MERVEDMDKKVIGVYDNGEDAVKGVKKLQDEGYERDDISVVAKDKEETKNITDKTKVDNGLAAGAATGGVLGGLTGLLAGIGALAIPGVGPIVAAGPIAATLSGMAAGIGAGGLAGGFAGMGGPDEGAQTHEKDVETGKKLVLGGPGSPKK